MRIVYILCNTSPTGGSTKSLISMITGMKNKGHEIAVVCPDRNGIVGTLESMSVQVFVQKYENCSLPPFKTLPQVIKWFPRLLRKIYRNQLAVQKLQNDLNLFKPEIIHENTSVTNIGYRLSKLLKVPYIIHVREYGYLDYGLIMPGIDRRLQGKDVWSIAITKGIQNYRNLKNSERSIQLYNGIITKDQFHYSPVKKRQFLFAGSLQQSKGVEDLIKGYIEYAKSSNEPFELLIAGSISDKKLVESLKKIILRNNLTKNVKWLGPISDLTSLYRTVAATIVPSHFECLGRVLPEAMANGCLCVGRNTAGTKEQFDNGEEISGQEIGYRFQTIDELASIMEEISSKYNYAYTNGNEYSTLINISQQVVRQYYSVEDYCDKLQEIYCKVQNVAKNMKEVESEEDN